jgi:PKD repeat protein
MKKTILLKISTLSLLLLTLMFTTTCKKVEEEKLPSADFTASKAAYVAGETIALTNTSSNGDNYRWTLPNGTTSKSQDLSYPTSENAGNGVLTFKLEAFSKSGNKSDFVVKEIFINAAKGKVVLYDPGEWDSYKLEIKIDGVSFGDVLIPSSSIIPNCGQSGYPTFDLTLGTHVLVIGGLWAKNFEIKKDACTKIDLYD